MRNIIQNRRGASLEGWTTAGVGVFMVLTLLAIVVVQMNVIYDNNNDATFGIGSGGTQELLEGYQGTLQEGLEGEASTNAITGVSLSSSYGMIKAGLSMAWDIVTGAWITNAIGLMQLGEAGFWLGWGLRLVFIFSIGYILLKILFKVKV